MTLFDLYSEYKEVPESELTPEKIKEIIDEEKSRVKQNLLKIHCLVQQVFYLFIGFLVMDF